MCTRSHPCGGILRVVLETPTFRIEHCLCGHSFRLGAQAFDREAPGASAHLNPKKRPQVPARMAGR